MSQVQKRRYVPGQKPLAFKEYNENE